MARPRTGERLVVSTRLEPNEVEAVEQLRIGNDVATQAEMIRLLVRQGIRAVTSRSDERPSMSPKPALTTEQSLERSAGLMEALSDLIARVEVDDPETAQRMADGVARSSAVYAHELRRRYK
jgi:hypothetical protein